MPREWKIEMPSTQCSNDEIYSWLAGYLAADGTVGVHNGQVTLSSAKKDDLLYIRVLCRKIGMGTYDVTEYRRKGLGKTDTPIYTMTFMKSDIDSMFLLRNSHRANFNRHAQCKHQARRWRVVAVEATGRVEPVYCADVQGFHNFIIEGDIVTHNCQYGDTRQKPTDIWTNHPDPKFLPPCKPGSPCHEAAPRGSRTGTQGRDGHVNRSLIPEKLCEHIVDICEEYINKA